MRKVLLFCVFYVAVRNTAAICTGQEFKVIQEKCLAANGGNRIMLEEFVKMKKASTEEGKCFRACLLETCDFMDASGNIVPNGYKPYLKAVSRNDPVLEQKFTQVFELCESVKIEANKCATAHNYMSCLSDECNGCVWNLDEI